MTQTTHRIERAMIGKGIEKVIAYASDPTERRKNLLQLVDMAEKIAGTQFKPQSYAAVRALITEDEGKWMGYVDHILDEVNPNVLRMTALNLGFEAAYYGTKMIRQKRRI